MRVDEEESEDLAVPGLGWVSEAKGRDAVLEDVGKGQKTALAGVDTAESLNGGTFVLDVVELLDAVVFVLRLVVRTGMLIKKDFRKAQEISAKGQ